MKNYQTLFEDYEKALCRLADALKTKDVKKGDLAIDGTIQRFEFTFELSWKVLKVYLNHQGINCNSPRMVIKESYGLGLLEDGDAWIDMLEDRNVTSHIYDAEQAYSIFQKIKDIHFGNFEKLKQKLASLL